MDVDVKHLPPGDPKLIDAIVSQLKSQGIFDEFRRDCLVDVDTKPAYQNLRRRVENFADDYLKNTQWRPDLNKNQLRDSLRKQIHDSGMLTTGIDRIIDQIVNPKIVQVFLPKVTEIVHRFLGIEKECVREPDPETTGRDTHQQSAPSASVAAEKKTEIECNVSTDAAEQLLKEDCVDNDDDDDDDDVDDEDSRDVKGKLEITTRKESKIKTAINLKDDSKLKTTEGGGSRKSDVSKTGTVKKTEVKSDGKPKPDTTEKPKSATADGTKVKSDALIKKESSKKDVPGGKSHSVGDSSGSKIKIKPTTTLERKPSQTGSPKITEMSPKSKGKSDSPKPDEETRSPKKSFDYPKGDSKKGKPQQQPPLTKSKPDGKPKPEKQKKDASEKTLNSASTPESSGKGKEIKTKPAEGVKPKTQSCKRDDGKPVGRKSTDVSAPPKRKDIGKDGGSSMGSGNKLAKATPEADPGRSKTLRDDVKAKKDPKRKSSESHRWSPAPQETKSQSKDEVGKEKSSEYKKQSEMAITRPSEISGMSSRQSISAAENKSPRTETAPRKRHSETTGSDDEHPAVKQTKSDSNEASFGNQGVSNIDSCYSDYDSADESGLVIDLSKCSPSSKMAVGGGRRSRVEVVEADGDGSGDNLSDVTVSSVHTSDLSDFDDRITLSESEEETHHGKRSSPTKTPTGKKSRSSGSRQAHSAVAKMQQEVRNVDRNISGKFADDDKSSSFRSEAVPMRAVGDVDREPRREMRRQRKPNPKYASDDFSSIFNSGKDRHGHGLASDSLGYGEGDHQADPTSASEVQPFALGRLGPPPPRSNTSEEIELPGSPVSSVSENGGEGNKKRLSEKPKWPCYESSEGDDGSRGSEIVEGAEFRPRTSSQLSGGSRKSQNERASLTPSPQAACTRSEVHSRRDSKTDSSLDSSSANFRRSQRRVLKSDSQRYDSTDLYKPRPVFSSSRRRATSPSNRMDSRGSSESEEVSRLTRSTQQDRNTGKRGRPRRVSTEEPFSVTSKRNNDEVPQLLPKRRR